MQLMDEILSDGKMDRFEKIEKLEAILSAATLLPSDDLSPESIMSVNFLFHLLFVNLVTQLIKA